jgi:hypothetical protein
MYQFRRTDNGEVVDVDFSTMMTMDAAGYITLTDGVLARRINRPTMSRSVSDGTSVKQMPIVSDSLGFPAHQLAEMEANRQQYGLKGVEFRPDPTMPHFMQAHFGSRKDYLAYMRHRGMFDKNSRNGSGAMLSSSLLERTQRRLAEVGEK